MENFMAQSKALVDALARVAALEARVNAGLLICREQRMHIAALEAQLAARGGLAVQRMGQRTIKRYMAPGASA
jgi:hypothetical protein